MRFCTTCQSDRDEEGGVTKRTGKFGQCSRWLCKSRAERKTVSIYKSKGGNTTQAKLDKLRLALYTRGT